MTNAEARFNNFLRPRKPEGSLGRTAQDGHLDSHTAPELCCLGVCVWGEYRFIGCHVKKLRGKGVGVGENRFIGCKKKTAVAAWA